MRQKNSAFHVIRFEILPTALQIKMFSINAVINYWREVVGELKIEKKTICANKRLHHWSLKNSNWAFFSNGFVVVSFPLFLFLKLKYVTIYICSITETYVRALRSIKKFKKRKKKTLDIIIKVVSVSKQTKTMNLKLPFEKPKFTTDSELFTCNISIIKIYKICNKTAIYFMNKKKKQQQRTN